MNWFVRQSLYWLVQVALAGVGIVGVQFGVLQADPKHAVAWLHALEFALGGSAVVPTTAYLLALRDRLTPQAPIVSKDKQGVSQ